MDGGGGGESGDIWLQGGNGWRNRIRVERINGDDDERKMNKLSKS